MNRKKLKAQSNNPHNTDQNICAQRVAMALGVADSVRYLHTATDLQRAARTRYSVRSVKSAVHADTVGAARRRVSRTGALAFIVIVPGHTLLLDATGATLIDSAPRKRDRRKIVQIHGVYPKKR